MDPKMSFLADNEYSNYDFSSYESIPMHSPSFPCHVFPDIPSSNHYEFGSCSMHFPPVAVSLTHMNGTARFTPSLPPEAFRYNCNPSLLQSIESMSSLASTVPLSKSKTDRAKKLTCGICKKTFLRPSAFRVHMRIHSGEKPFQCIHCPRSFSQSGNLTVHMRMHTGERPFTCPVCCKGFSQSNSLKVHLRTHTGEKPFECGDCMKRFADSKIVEAFVPVSIGVMSSCAKYGNSRDNVRKRKNEYPEKIGKKLIYEPFHISCCLYHYCCIGEKEMSLGPSLVIGYRGPFVLYSPPKRSWPIQEGAPHIIRESVTRQKKPSNVKDKAKPHCKICNKFFTRKSSLIVHMRGHSGNRPFKCSYCPKAFVQSANLVTHQRTHTGEKPYACSVCGKCFSQSCSVTAHMRTHTGERPFQCAECGMAFAERSTLSKHYRVHTRKSASK